MAITLRPYQTEMVVIKMAGKIKHNLSKTKLYQTWRNIRQRCNNPKATHYKYYGGKGIKVCNEWENDFLKFYEWSIQNGYKEGLTIDRKGGWCNAIKTVSSEHGK